MAEGKVAGCTRLTLMSCPQKRRSGKKKKEAKKEKRVPNVGN